jgi:hypothetical protein
MMEVAHANGKKKSARDAVEVVVRDSAYAIQQKFLHRSVV